MIHNGALKMLAIKITATNFSPPDYSKPDGNWCNPPQQHFDLSMPLFTKITIYKAGIIPVKYRRIPCSKQGGVKFEIKGSPFWNLVLLYNVGGARDVTNVKIRGSKTNGWLQMSRIWGQNWLSGTNLVEQSLSFQVTVSDGKTLEFENVAPNCQFRYYDGKFNF